MGCVESVGSADAATPLSDNHQMSFPQRAQLLGDQSQRGLALARRLCELTDEWLAGLYAVSTEGVRKRTALVAVGGYGRGELAPGSDLDVWLVHDGVRNIDEIAQRLWYPVWDSRLMLGHAVRTPKEVLAACGTDLETATSSLSMRCIVGDHSLAADVAQRASREWQRRGVRWLNELRGTVEQRHSSAGEVAYLLEPSLKDGIGGLRDFHSIGWARAAGADPPAIDLDELVAAYQVLMSARVELHRTTGRNSDVLALQEQSAVADALGYSTADELMAHVAAAGRSISWASDDLWVRVGIALGRSAGSTSVTRQLAPAIVLIDGEVRLDPSVDLAADPALLIRVGVCAAREQAPIAHSTLDHLAIHAPVWPTPWPPGALDELVALLLTGHAAIAVLEALDQRELFTSVLPEWRHVRSKPQRNAYHRFTVDRHLWEATANAAAIADRVARPDLLMIGTLLHDLGKGLPGDHTDRGIELAELLGPRMGLSAADTEIIVDMVRHHLLLPDVATRRDIGDDATIDQVADLVRDRTRLELLAALTEADSLATGASAWSSWKAELVAELVRRVDHVLGGGRPGDLPWELFPSAEVVALMALGERQVLIDRDRITTLAPDRPGLFSRVAGVMSLHGLDVVSARAHSEEPQPGRIAMAANEFRLVGPIAQAEAERVRADVIRAVVGHLAIDARLAERARTYRRRRSLVAHPVVPGLTIEPAGDSTIIEVRAADHIGVLYRITNALADLGLDLRHATVQTLGAEVVDTFYVRHDGGPVSDIAHLEDIRLAVMHAVGSGSVATAST